MNLRIMSSRVKCVLIRCYLSISSDKCGWQEFINIPLITFFQRQ